VDEYENHIKINSKIKLGANMNKYQLGGWEIQKIGSLKRADDPLPYQEKIIMKDLKK
jgi:hypothetical protein